MRKLLILILLVSIGLVSASDDLLALQGKVDQSGTLVESGDIVVEIWDDATAGNMVYNSTSDFNGAIQGGFFDIVLGSGTNSLTLNLSQTYYMDIAIEGQDIDWGADERRQFQSTVGRPYFEEEVVLNDTLYTKDGYVGIHDISPAHTLSISGNLSLDSTDYSSCTALETDSGGGIVCGTDDAGSGGVTTWDENLAWFNETALNATIALWIDNDTTLTALAPDLAWFNESTLNATIALWIDNNTAAGGITTWDENLAWMNETSLNSTIALWIDNNTDTQGITTWDENLAWFNETALNATIALWIDNNTDTQGITTWDENLAWFNETALNATIALWIDNNTDSGAGITTYWAGSAVNELYNDTASGVGIGTSNPNYKLEVNSVDAALNVSSMLYVNESSVGIGTESPGNLLSLYGDTTGNIRLLIENVDTTGQYTQASLALKSGEYQWIPFVANKLGDQLRFYSTTSKSNVMVLTNDSKVGISTESPVYSLEVNSVDAALNVSSMLYVNESSVGIGTDVPGWELHVVGSSNITGELFVGGNITGSGADVAEFIGYVGHEPEVGDVVVIDYKNENKVKKSDKAYDTRVAGIVSTKPGLILASKVNGILLAVSGRVPTKVTNENGKIVPGDLLTTSSLDGYAMKCDNIDKCRGAIVAKALESSNKKKDKINALVMLG